MNRIVFFENWQQQLIQTIADVESRLAPISDAGQEAYRYELDRLNELLHQVREVEPEHRVPVTSVILPLMVKGDLQLPPELVARLADLFDIYRRFRTRLNWTRD
jgi:hypothetical protein